jgi:hypothetical protein
VVTSSLAVAGVASAAGTAAQGETTSPRSPSPAMATTQPIAPGRSELPDAAFGKLDASNKGYVTKDEVRSLDGFNFDAYDRDRDGKLSRDEFMHGWKDYSGSRTQ